MSLSLVLAVIEAAAANLSNGDRAEKNLHKPGIQVSILRLSQDG